jgi:hypothetical protein
MTKAGLTDVQKENKEIGRDMETRNRKEPIGVGLFYESLRSDSLRSRCCDFGLANQIRFEIGGTNSQEYQAIPAREMLSVATELGLGCCASCRVAR